MWGEGAPAQYPDQRPSAPPTTYSGLSELHSFESERTGLLGDIVVGAIHQPSDGPFHPHLYQSSSIDGQFSGSSDSKYGYPQSKPPINQEVWYGQQQHSNHAASWQPHIPSSSTDQGGGTSSQAAADLAAFDDHSFADVATEQDVYPPRKSDSMAKDLLSQAFDRLYKMVWKRRSFSEISRLLCHELLLENVNPELAHKIINGNKSQKEEAVERLLNTQGPEQLTSTQRYFILEKIQDKLTPSTSRTPNKRLSVVFTRNYLLQPMLASKNRRLADFALENFPESRSRSNLGFDQS